MATIMATGALAQGDETRGGGRVAAWWPALAILLMALACRLWWFGNPATDLDAPFYSYVGNAMLHGQLPYVDVWDRKPIGLFLIYAAAHAVFGPGANAYLTVALGFAWGGAFLTFLIARRLAGQGTGLVCAALYLLGLDAYGSRGGQSELFFAVPCLAMAWLLIVRRGSFRALALAMLLGGIAIQIKYSVAPFCAVAGLIALVQRWQAHRRPLRLGAEAMALAAIGLAPTLLAWLAYVAMGEGPAFVFANFVSIFLRPVTVGRWPAETLAAIGPLFLTAAVGLWAFFRMGRSYAKGDYAILAALAAGAIAAIFSTANVLAYYYAFLLPWAVLLAVPFIDVRVRAGQIGAGLLLAAFLLAANYPWRIAESRRDVATFDRIVQRIGDGARAGGLYVVYGPSSLYLATGTQGGRFAFPSHHSAGFEDGALGVSQRALVEAALNRHPRFVVTLSDPRMDPGSHTAPIVARAMRQGYVARERGTILSQDLTLWERL